MVRAAASADLYAYLKDHRMPSDSGPRRRIVANRSLPHTVLTKQPHAFERNHL